MRCGLNKLSHAKYLPAVGVEIHDHAGAEHEEGREAEEHESNRGVQHEVRVSEYCRDCTRRR